MKRILIEAMVEDDQADRILDDVQRIVSRWSDFGTVKWTATQEPFAPGQLVASRRTTEFFEGRDMGPQWKFIGVRHDVPDHAWVLMVDAPYNVGICPLDDLIAYVPKEGS